MAKSNKGSCQIRNIPVNESNLCDLYDPKRKGSLKPRCKNCVHFLKDNIFSVRQKEKDSCERDDSEEGK